jgi:S1-C subfamily serine protease
VTTLRSLVGVALVLTLSHGLAERTLAAAPKTGTFATLAEAVKPAVVNVSLMEDFFGEGPQRAPGHGIGSGVLIDPSGLALTNAHVVEGSSRIEVTTVDGARYPARLVGADRKTDLAVIRLEAGGQTFPALPLGDSDAVRVGDWVIAVGSPFGLSATVTSGIVSATARQVGAGPHDDFLQTDAAINPGNSGGPLVNMRGEIIGINTALVRGGSGIGFAIPANMARRISAGLIADGAVSRGWLGVSRQPLIAAVPGEPPPARLGLTVQPLTHAAPTAGVRARAGVLVTTVEPDGLAARAGIRPGDVVLEVEGRPVKSGADLTRLTRGLRPGRPLSVRLERGGRALYVALGAARG